MSHGRQLIHLPVSLATQCRSARLQPFSKSKTSRSEAPDSSRAAKMPAGPAPTMMTSKSLIRLSPCSLIIHLQRLTRPIIQVPTVSGNPTIGFWKPPPVDGGLNVAKSLARHWKPRGHHPERRMGTPPTDCWSAGDLKPRRHSPDNSTQEVCPYHPNLPRGSPRPRRPVPLSACSLGEKDTLKVWLGWIRKLVRMVELTWTRLGSVSWRGRSQG